MAKKFDKHWYTNVGQFVMLQTLPKLQSGVKLVEDVAPDTPASFPTIFYTQLNPVEIGQDLENREINAIDCTVEVRGYVNTGKSSDCKRLLNPVIEGFKRYGFNVSMFPIYSKSRNTVEGIVRFRRVIGAGDTDLTYRTVAD